MVRRLALLPGAVLAGPWLALLTAGAAAAESVAWEVTGKGLESDPRLPALERVLAAASAEALGGLRARLGLAPGKTPVRWTVDVSVAPLAAGPHGQETPRPGFFESGRTSFAGGAVVVSIPARRFLARPAAAAAPAAHEAAHAVLASSLGPDRHDAVPRWFREGIAVWFAGEGRARVDEMIAGNLIEGRAASAFLAGLPARGEADEAGGARVTHAEAFLAVLWLERRAGGEGLAAIATAAAGGSDVIERIEKVAGLAFDGARALALDFARAEVRRRIGEEAEALFRTSLRLREESRGEEAAAAWRSLLSRDPAGPLVPTLLYLLARAGVDGTGGGEARAEAGARLRRLLALPDAPWRPEALVLEGERLRAAADIPAARRAWSEVLEAYGDDPVPAARAMKLLEATGGRGVESSGTGKRRPAR
jgi:TolA-binding protein